MSVSILLAQTFNDGEGFPHVVQNANIVDLINNESGYSVVLQNATLDYQGQPTHYIPVTSAVFTTVSAALAAYQTALQTLTTQQSQAAITAGQGGNFITQAMLATGTTTMTSTPSIGSVVNMTGALTGSAVLKMPTVPPAGWWAVFVNETTGAHTSTIEGSSGTGIAIAGNGTNSGAMLYSDGINIWRVTPDTANTP
jgi:hypothetical protein